MSALFSKVWKNGVGRVSPRATPQLCEGGRPSKRKSINPQMEQMDADISM